jgi:hypothetical protein
MNKDIPKPGDLIEVLESQWYGVQAGGMLRVCESTHLLDPENQLLIAPRSRVKTFWGPETGPPDGSCSLSMITSGGPFKTVQIEDLESITRIGQRYDTFWCWKDIPRPRGGMDHYVQVSVWRLPMLRDNHGREPRNGKPKSFEDPVSNDSPPWDEPKEMTVHPIIRQVINRDCHVSESNKRVIQHVVSKLKHGLDTFRQMTPEDRRRFIQQCVIQHKGNLREYQQVMFGFSGDRSLIRSNLTKNGTLTGHEIVQLMRKHRKTIEGLSFRMGISQKRIRHCRENGLSDPHAVRDWLEAITGEDPGPLPVAYRIASPVEEDCCNFCGYPLGIGDTGFEYAGDVFCSIFCCRKSRNW